MNAQVIAWRAERITVRTTILSSPVPRSRSVCAGHKPERRPDEPDATNEVAIGAATASEGLGRICFVRVVCAWLR